MKRLRTLVSAFFVASCAGVIACTSAIVAGRLTPGGNALLWKHRDSGSEHNFVARVDAGSPDEAAYVALFNAGDTLLQEAWTGLNSRGFAVMNTASYNLVPDTAAFRDREGYVMTAALKRCRSVDDFASLLDTLPKPLGVQANFGVIDRDGNGAYFETWDYGYRRYDLADAPEGFLCRTNYSCSGDSTCGFGYIREQNALTLMRPSVGKKCVTPQLFTDTISRSFYHSLYDRDLLRDAADGSWLVDQDFIPRNSSCASIVIDGDVMWTVIGYPPCSYALPVTVDSVPPQLFPGSPEGHSALCDSVVARKREVFPIKRGSGPHYINVDRLRHYLDSCGMVSRENFSLFRRDLGRGVGED